jgi:hypothetical protein
MGVPVERFAEDLEDPGEDKRAPWEKPGRYPKGKTP